MQWYHIALMGVGCGTVLLLLFGVGGAVIMALLARKSKPLPLAEKKSKLWQDVDDAIENAL